ncbi:dTDP-4-dehydrorhamnose 3,5-epimerase [Pseudoduganella plicata]|uniref:dTDP-4-dehydrorhamnose 3,5-epimerase n=1 Tax=Pseudoduganella plicata TaxID=321984 RepID=A0A4P7BDR6_9BURK|nr:dTDP-4-dehydrorhamnose 3,5-epimerase [Pseudoduganella plicata]QBQ36821.1 dTDP-4-dehydrorhamnose 3,5-epimerase [Pseudoduganella plicata]GGY72443.1 dTDP-4-dehydrorhamnose 3,5-epimerase [Pseudoduganella plicata]
MKVTTTPIEGLLVIEPTVYGDERGFFFESFNARRFADLTGIHAAFVQDNHSRSARNVLRGMHYQIRQAQGKLVRVVSGSVYDVVVDLRKSSATFGQWFGVELSAENKRQCWIPPGLAHGFAVTSEFAEFLYKTTDYYAPEHERALLWNDPEVGIEWPLDGMPLLSAKDQKALPLTQVEVFA